MTEIPAGEILYAFLTTLFFGGGLMALAGLALTGQTKGIKYAVLSIFIGGAMFFKDQLHIYIPVFILIVGLFTAMIHYSTKGLNNKTKDPDNGVV